MNRQIRKINDPVLGVFAFLVALLLMVACGRSVTTPTSTRPISQGSILTDKTQDVYLQVSAGHPAVINANWFASMENLTSEGYVKVDVHSGYQRHVTFTCWQYRTDPRTDKPAFSCIPFSGKGSSEGGTGGQFYLSATDLDDLFRSKNALAVLPELTYPDGVTK